MHRVLIFCLVLICSIQCEKRLLFNDACYGELGCFTTRPPFSGSLARPISLLPSQPEEIDTQFYLYTKNNPTTPKRIYFNETSLDFDPTWETKILIPGFLHNAFKNYIVDLKNAFMKLGNFNVITVDWSKGNGFPYTQAVSNAQLVGAEIARLVKSLAKNSGLNFDTVHLIGQSLGAHVAGYAGERIPGLGRITGLDPAGPYFENTDPKVRLDETDADFVDVIHTDGSPVTRLGLGMLQRSGHVDFYPNGGKEQPKCSASTQKIISSFLTGTLVNFDSIEKASGCSHLSAANFFTDSILNKECKYVAYPCNNVDDFNTGKCIRCTVKGCNTMGYWASPKHDIGSLYLNTQSGEQKPFCQHHYLLTLNSNNLEGQTQTRGLFTVEIESSSNKSAEVVIDDSTYTFRPDSSNSHLINSTAPIGNTIIGAKIKFTKTAKLLSSWLYQDQWSFKNIEIIYGDTQFYAKLCPVSEFIKSNSFTTFVPC